MKCKNPFMYENQIPFGCGQCLTCRINRRRIWTHRMMLEAVKHKRSSFVTLTYSPEYYPKGGTLVPKDLQDFIKRLRRANPNKTIRYYGVGEYGDRTQRAHYHLALFGLGQEDTRTISNCWNSDRSGPIKRGHVYVGTLTKDSAQYVAGYITKKLTKRGDPKLNGREPEFARMSLKPGLGVEAMKDVANYLLTALQGNLTQLEKTDVPMTLTHHQEGKKKEMPLGRYLRKKLREYSGFNNIGAQEGWKEEVLINTKVQMSLMFEALSYTEEDKKLWKKLNKGVRDGGKKTIIVEANKGYNEQLELHEEAYKQRRTI